MGGIELAILATLLATLLASSTVILEESYEWINQPVNESSATFAAIEARMTLITKELFESLLV